jgi:hypothetical protein
MPKKSKLPKEQVAPAEQIENPTPRILVMEERDKLAAIFADPVFVRAWHNAEMASPSLFPQSVGQFDGQFGDANAARALARKQGWEMHKAALLRQAKEIVQSKPAAKEEFPDSGTLEAEIKNSLPRTK